MRTTVSACIFRSSAVSSSTHCSRSSNGSVFSARHASLRFLASIEKSLQRLRMFSMRRKRFRQYIVVHVPSRFTQDARAHCEDEYTHYGIWISTYLSILNLSIYGQSSTRWITALHVSQPHTFGCAGEHRDAIYQKVCMGVLRIYSREWYYRRRMSLSNRRIFCR